ncbi:hypothetical protein [Arthrobacter sp. S2(2024)]|uniref:hypothetical protein n=1 Tax=Arthrobacter sp. S2(2024) TaxID=3111911 RepID=UPI002FC88EC1
MWNVDVGGIAHCDRDPVTDNVQEKDGPFAHLEFPDAQQGNLLGVHPENRCACRSVCGFWALVRWQAREAWGVAESDPVEGACRCADGKRSGVCVRQFLDPHHGLILRWKGTREPPGDWWNPLSWIWDLEGNG